MNRRVSPEEHEERIAALVEQSRGGRSDDECWLWVGRLSDKGYAVYGERSTRIARKLAATPFGLDTLHRCGTKACVNPAHLKPGTHQENLDDGKTRGEFPKGLDSTNGKLSPEQIDAIKVDPRNNSEVAREYGVHPSTVLRLRRGYR